MSYARVLCVGLVGVTGHVVEVEADLSPGLPAVVLTGLPDAALNEARDRVRAAVVNSGQDWPNRRITVNPGARLSLQKHFHRAEHWIVVRGTAEVTIDGEIRIVHENEPAYIPIGAAHRLANPGKIPLELIEVQVGSYTGEDDIVRLEDAYNRAY